MSTTRGPELSIVFSQHKIGAIDPGINGEPTTVSRRFYLIMAAMDAGADIWTAVEAVSSTAIEHADWDMDEKRTLADWESEHHALN